MRCKNRALALSATLPTESTDWFQGRSQPNTAGEGEEGGEKNFRWG